MFCTCPEHRFPQLRRAVSSSIQRGNSNTIEEDIPHLIFWEEYRIDVATATMPIKRSIEDIESEPETGSTKSSDWSSWSNWSSLKDFNTRKCSDTRDEETCLIDGALVQIFSFPFLSPFSLCILCSFLSLFSLPSHFVCTQVRFAFTCLRCLLTGASDRDNIAAKLQQPLSNCGNTSHLFITLRCCTYVWDNLKNFYSFEKILGDQCK